MTRLQFGVLYVLLMALVTTTAIPVLRGTNVAATKWQYMIEAVPDETFRDSMNELGEDGWELVFARRASNGERGDSMEMSYECIFKRPL